MSNVSVGIPRTLALDRAMDVLVAVAESDGATSASALARATAQPRPTVSRTLRTLLDRGLVIETGQGWIIGHELYRLARLGDPRSAVIEAAGRPLRRLRDESGESALLAIAIGRTHMEIVTQLDAPHHLGVVGWVGADVPLHASSAGKVLLAELSPAELQAWIAEARPSRLTSKTVTDAAGLSSELAHVRRRGWAQIVDELEDGLVSLSAPIRDRAGALTAMIGISGPTTRLNAARRKALRQLVLEAAAEVERSLSPSATRSHA
jgi:DNA-binding IclR family transcriptional regulator